MPDCLINRMWHFNFGPRLGLFDRCPCDYLLMEELREHKKLSMRGKLPKPATGAALSSP
jgi:hypothetical protein